MSPPQEQQHAQLHRQQQQQQQQQQTSLSSTPPQRVSVSATATAVRVQATTILPNSNCNQSNNNQQHNNNRHNVPVIVTSLSSLQRIQQYEGRYRDQTTPGTTSLQSNTTTNGTSTTNNITKFEWEEIIPMLIKQKYYLPYKNQSFWNDYKQYYYNNHPLFSLCCYNKRLHPIGLKIRLWTLIGSIMFGICITNCIWLWFYYNSINNIDSNNNNSTTNAFDDAILIINLRKDFDNNDEGTESSASSNTMTITSTDTIKQLWDEYESKINNNDYYNIRITYGMIMLWTIGAFLHSIYDSIIWKLDACYCCYQRDYEKYISTITYSSSTNVAATAQSSILHPSDITNNKWRKFSQKIVILSTVVLIAFTTCIVVMRAAANATQIQQQQLVLNFYQHVQQYNTNNGNNEESFSIHYSILDDWINEKNSNSNNNYSSLFFMMNGSNYKFLYSYIIEFVIAVIVYYPLTVYLLFSGIFDCYTGTIPIIGGRLYDIKSYNRSKQKRIIKQQQQRGSGSGRGTINALSPTNSQDNTASSSSNSYNDLEFN